MTPTRRLAFLVIAAAALAQGCALRSSDPIVDGWAIGGQFDCGDQIRSGLPCAQEVRNLIAVAVAGFEERNRGHAPIVEVTLHEEGVVYDLSGNAILATRSGSCCDVARLLLADGSVRAIGVGYPGISQEPMAIFDGPN